MSDIVERLREWSVVYEWAGEAADLIERQRAVIEELKKRAEIDRQQCDDMTDEAGKLAMENKNQRAVIEAAFREGYREGFLDAHGDSRDKCEDSSWELSDAKRALDGGDDE